MFTTALREQHNSVGIPGLDEIYYVIINYRPIIYKALLSLKTTHRIEFKENTGLFNTFQRQSRELLVDKGVVLNALKYFKPK